MVKKLLVFLIIVNTVSLYSQTYTMSNGSLSVCGGTFLDPGGNANYIDSSDFTQTLCSSSGKCIAISFQSFGLENGYDFLRIYDGATTTSAQFSGSPFTGNVPPGIIKSTTGCLTLVFTSDYSF